MDIKIDSLLYRGQGAPVSTTNAKKDLRLARSCQDFESVFLTTLWRSMAKNSGMDVGGWDVLLSQAVGKAWAGSGGIGLAKVPVSYTHLDVYKRQPETCLKDTRGTGKQNG